MANIIDFVSDMKIWRLRFAWLVLAALAAFVIFVECLAEVGGEHEAIPRPTGPVATVPATP